MSVYFRGGSRRVAQRTPKTTRNLADSYSLASPDRNPEEILNLFLNYAGLRRAWPAPWPGCIPSYYFSSAGSCPTLSEVASAAATLSSSAAAGFRNSSSSSRCNLVWCSATRSFKATGVPASAGDCSLIQSLRLMLSLKISPSLGLRIMMRRYCIPRPAEIPTHYCG